MSSNIAVFARLRPARPAAYDAVPETPLVPSTPMRSGRALRRLASPGGDPGGITPGGPVVGLVPGPPMSRHAFTGLRILDSSLGTHGFPTAVGFEERLPGMDGMGGLAVYSGVTPASIFDFDSVFPPEANQRAVWEICGSEHVDGVLDGYNSSILAYGRTGRCVWRCWW